MTLSTAARKARAIAGIMLLTFGGCWLVGSVLPQLIPGAERFVGAVFPIGGAVSWALMHRIFKGSAQEAGPEDEVQRLYKRIMWDSFLLELILIPALIAIMIAKGLGGIIPSMIAVAVGVHFVPMAGAFRLPLYYGLGVALAGLGVYGAILLPDGQWIVGTLAGVILIVGGALLRR